MDPVADRSNEVTRVLSYRLPRLHSRVYKFIRMAIERKAKLSCEYATLLFLRVPCGQATRKATC